MYRLFVLVAFAILLSACNPYVEYQAKKSVRQQLKDPESAQFSDFQIAGDGLLVCGKVNAKNSMGGYVGGRTFMIWKDDVTVASDELESIKLSTCCINMKHAVDLHKDSTEIEGLASACSAYNIEQFSWPKPA